MARGVPILFALALAGCAAHPRDTILSLDMDSPQFRSRACREARQEALAYDNRPMTKGMVAVLGDLVAPFMGTAASLALEKADDPKRERINRRLAEACMADPLGERRQATGRRAVRF